MLGLLFINLLVYATCCIASNARSARPLDATLLADHTAVLARRSSGSQSPWLRRHALPPVVSGPPRKATASAASPSSMQQTASNCQSALAALNGQPKSPTGMSVCFAVQSLDRSTGAFDAQILLYQVGPARGRWIGINPRSQGMSLNYENATAAVAPSSSAPTAQTKSLARGATPKLARRAAAPMLVDSMSLNGQLNANMKAYMNNDDMLKAALTPQVIISARAQQQAGQGVQPQLSDMLIGHEAAFVNGVFQSIPPQRIRQAASATAPIAANGQAANASAPFELPGRSLGIFPVGLIITGAWAVAFLVVVGFGTATRIWHRKQFRRQTTLPVQWGGTVAAGKAGYEQWNVGKSEEW